jgi:hypothetical protein
MSTDVTLSGTWQQISDGTRSLLIIKKRAGLGYASCEIAFETSTPAASVGGLNLTSSGNFPATTEKVYARGQGVIQLTFYTPK